MQVMDTALLEQIRSTLANAYGSRLRGILLFGSQARGTASADSDVDLLVLLSGPIQLYSDTHRSAEALGPLGREWGHVFSTHVADEEDVRAMRAPLYVNAMREGTWI